MKLPLLASLLLLTIVGCATGAPPSALERTLYSVTTNYHTQVIPVAIIGTNATVTATNYVTNVVATYDLHERESVRTGVSAGGAVASTFGFGAGGVIASILLGLYGAWAKFKNVKSNKLNVVLSQGIETAREIMVATSGVNVEKRFVEEMKSQQVDADVKKEATKVSSENVNTAEAKKSAEDVISPSNIPSSRSKPLP